MLIYEINNFYIGKETRIFSMCTKSNKDALKWYLSNFSDVYEYCREIYFINDEKFVNEMIESGKRPINSGDRVLEYMELAKRFWELKKIKLKEEGLI